MKKIICLILINFSIATSSFTHLKDGDIALKWTLADINGNVQSLYNYLVEGKFMKH